MKIAIKKECHLAACYLRHANLLSAADSYDIIISSKYANADILESHRRILLVERIDCASIWCRKQLQHPHVKTLLKMYHYPSLEINNAPCVDGRVFMGPGGLTHHSLLTAADLAKVKCGLNFFHYPCFDEIIQYVEKVKRKPFSKRKFDASFAGTTKYSAPGVSVPWITDHRTRCADNVARLGRSGLSVASFRDRKLPLPEYLDMLLETKIALSPFGWGEFCYRDYEALLCGCIVVKPCFPATASTVDIRPFIVDSKAFENFNKAEFKRILDMHGADQDEQAAKVYGFLTSERAKEKQTLCEILKG